MPRFRSYNKGKTVVKRVDAWVKSEAAKARLHAKEAAKAAIRAQAAAGAAKWTKAMQRPKRRSWAVPGAKTL